MRRNGLRDAFFVTLFVASPICSAQSGTGSTSLTAPPTSIVAATLASSSPTASIVCASRTINYITHTLPQQCLRTDWARGGNGTRSQGSAGAGASDTGVKDARQNDTGSEHILGGGATDVEQTTTSADLAVAPSENIATLPSTAADTTNTEPLSTPVPTPTSIAASIVEPDTEGDSALDSAKFLSFEEWKKANLEKVGQSPENLGSGRSPHVEGRRRPVNNALESLGDEAEIDIDFGGFGASTEEKPTSQQAPQPSSGTPPQDSSAESSLTEGHHRRKDAGVTCKERFNYASFDCAATILKTNPRSKSASRILVESKDSYMLNECTEGNKFVIVELCDDILVDTVVLANFEFFSSTFRTFRVSISDRYPVKADRWKDLGTFEARNAREIQAFPVLNPLIWARYLRVEFLTHYGSEFYCPVSLLRVHGTTMMEEFRHQDESARHDDEVDDDVAQTESTSEQQVAVTAVPPAVDIKLGSVTSLDQPVRMDEPDNTPVSMQDPPTTMSNSTSFAISNTPSGSSTGPEPHLSSPTASPVSKAQESSSSLSTQLSSLAALTLTEPITEIMISTTTHSASDTVSGSPSITVSSATRLSPSTTIEEQNKPAPSSETIDVSAAASAVSPLSKPGSQQPAPPPVQESSRTASSSTPIEKPPPPAAPTTQESFFKSVHKRLQMLEANSTLSLQYIEEQSRILRDAFSKVEKRQTSKTTTFLTHLNDTVITELHALRTQYDQLWQSTVLELESHRERYQGEIGAVSARLTLIADELLWQKRITVVQSTLLLICLGLVVFIRLGGAGVDVPLVQQMLGGKRQSMVFRPVSLGVEASFDSSIPASPSSGVASPPSQYNRRVVRIRDGEESDYAEDFINDKAMAVPDSPIVPQSKRKKKLAKKQQRQQQQQQQQKQSQQQQQQRQHQPTPPPPPMLHLSPATTSPSSGPDGEDPLFEEEDSELVPLRRTQSVPAQAREAPDWDAEDFSSPPRPEVDRGG